jgi:hypothetical protein
LFVVKVRGVAVAARGGGYLLFMFAISLAGDVLYIALTRWMLRRISSIDRWREIMLNLFLNLFVLISLVIVPIYITQVTKPELGAVIVFSLLLNTVNFLAASAGVVVALMLLLHRSIWWPIERPIYVIQRYVSIDGKKNKETKKWLFRIGLGLVLLPSHDTLEFLKLWLKKLL